MASIDDQIAMLTQVERKVGDVMIALGNLQKLSERMTEHAQHGMEDLDQMMSIISAVDGGREVPSLLDIIARLANVHHLLREGFLVPQPMHIESLKRRAGVMLKVRYAIIDKIQSLYG